MPIVSGKVLFLSFVASTLLSKLGHCHIALLDNEGQHVSLYCGGRQGAFLSCLLLPGDVVQASYFEKLGGPLPRKIIQELGFAEPQPSNKTQRIELAGYSMDGALEKARRDMYYQQLVKVRTYYNTGSSRGLS